MSDINNTTNTLAWVQRCREHNPTALKNTATGKWLDVALTIIQQQFNEIQKMNNDRIDETYYMLLCPSCKELEKPLFDVGDGCPMCGEPLIDASFADSE